MSREKRENGRERKTGFKSGGLKLETTKLLMKRRANLVAAALLCVAMGGCALLGGAKKAPDTYDLLAPGAKTAGHRTSLQIVVNTPSAVRALASDHILVKPALAQLVYFPNAVWSDQLPRLVQARLVESLQNSGRFRAVGDGRDKIDADVQIISNIRAFQIEVVGQSATARIEIFIKLVDDDSRRTVSSRKFTAFEQASGNSTGAGVEALNRAFHKLMPAVVRWVSRVKVYAKAS